MKDQEFIELLNLYLDHEISEADAARLESEVQRNAARYRVYREYCQMHKACALLSPAFPGEVPSVTTLETRARPWSNPFAIGGLMAAAAAVAFVFVNQTSTPSAPSSNAVAESAVVSPSAENQLAMTPGAQAPRSIGPTVTVPITLTRVDYQPSSATQTLRWNTNEVAPATVKDARFNWIETLQLVSVPEVPADSLRFEAKTIQKDAPRAFGPGAFEGPTEYNAIHFQR